ncbi:hypothetical protein EV714DRAFT_285616 [Schizophyllum commune]
MAFITDLDDPCDDALLAPLTPRELFALARTCHLMHGKVRFFLIRAFNYERALARFVPEDKVRAFREMQRLTGAVISGSFALHFMGRYTWPVHDLDLYVEERCASDAATCFFGMGYVYEPREGQFADFEDELENAQNREYADNYPIDALKAAFNFKKGSALVQLLVTPTAVMEIILQFHTTGVMNLITHSTAYSLYPRSTFDEGRSLLMKPFSESPKLLDALDKYEDRGLTIVRSIGRFEASDATREFGKRYRWVGDAMTWVLPLPGTGDDPVVYTDHEDHALYRSWRLRYDRRTSPNGISSILDPSVYMRVLASHPLHSGYPDVTGMTFAYAGMKDEFRRIARNNVSHPFWWYPEDGTWIARLVCEGISSERHATTLLACAGYHLPRRRRLRHCVDGAARRRSGR